MIIESYNFGHITVSKRDYTSDLKIIKGEVHPNWWRKEGHRLSFGDIEDIVEARPKVLVVGTGAYGVMVLEEGLTERLNSIGIEVLARPTQKAVQAFNDLFKKMGSRDVAGAFHLTC